MRYRLYERVFGGLMPDGTKWSLTIIYHPYKEVG